MTPPTPRARLTSALLPFALACSVPAAAQWDTDLALATSRPAVNTTANEGITLAESDAPGTFGFSLPMHTRRVDLLNARGKVVRSCAGSDATALDLPGLRPGTWTLRVHAPEGMEVRRFVVVRRGSIAWAVPRAPRKR